MIVLTNLTEQTLAPGQSLIFDEVILHSGRGECHRRNTGTIGLRANCGVYSVSYGANIDGATAAAPVQLSLQLNGSTLPETTAISAAAGFNNVSRSTIVKNCCDGGNRIALVNTGTTPVVVGANSVLTVARNS